LKKILVEKYQRKIKLISKSVKTSYLYYYRTKIIGKGFSLKYSLFSMLLYVGFYSMGYSRKNPYFPDRQVSGNSFTKGDQWL